MMTKFGYLARIVTLRLLSILSTSIYSNSSFAQNLIDPISKSRTVFTRINSDFGPRNVTEGSIFHKGIDYELYQFNSAYSIIDGDITEVRHKAENIDYVVVNDTWRYMHFPTINPDYTWEVIDDPNDLANQHNTCDLIVIRRVVNGSLELVKVLSSKSCPNTLFYDFRTDQSVSIQKKVIEGEKIFISKSGSLGNHLHLDKGYGVNINPLEEVAHSRDNDPEIEILDFQKIVNSSILINQKKLFGETIVLTKSSEKIDKDLNLFELLCNENVLKDWSYSRNKIINSSEVHILTTENSIRNSNRIGVFPLGDASSDFAKYPINTLRLSDGIKKITFRVHDILSDYVSNSKTALIDNFLPYIEKVFVRKNNQLIYQGNWTLSSDEPKLDFSKCTFTNSPITSAFDIEIHSSEHLKNLRISIPNSNISNYSMYPNKDSTVWLGTLNYLPFTNNGGEVELIFSGEDLAGNQLLVNPSTLYHRISDVAWEPSNPIKGSDRNHKLNLPQSCTGNCKDENEDNNTIASATRVSGGIGDANDKISTIYSCLNFDLSDVDWYYLPIANSGNLTITLQKYTNEFEMELYQGSKLINRSVRLSNGNKILSFTNSALDCSGGSYYIKVFPISSYSVKDYNYSLNFNWDYKVPQSLANARIVSTLNTSSISISGNTNLCSGQTAQYTASGGSGSYIWYLNGKKYSTSSIITLSNLNLGEHGLLLEDANSPCQASSIIINIKNTLVVNAGYDKTISFGGSVQLQGSGGSNFQWTPTIGLSNPNIWNPIASPSQTTTYTLTASENGCSGTDQVRVTVGSDGGITPPSNDNCSSAFNLISNTTKTYSTGSVKNATSSYGSNLCAGCGCISPDDKDVYYKFTAVANSHTVHLANFSSNFDAVIELRNSCGLNTGLGCYDPVGIINPTSRTFSNLTIGQTYYVRIFEFNYTGTPPESDFFDICITHEGTTLGQPDLISRITNISNTNPNQGEQIAIEWDIINNGDKDITSTFFKALYLSKDLAVSSTDIYFTSSVHQTTSLRAGQKISLITQVVLPNIEDGAYYVLADPDVGNYVTGNDISNDISFYPIYLGQKPQNGPNLEFDGMTITPNSNLAPGQEINVEVEIENTGNRNSNRFYVKIVFDSNDNGNYDPSDLVLGTITYPSLDIGENDARDRDYRLPSNISSIGSYRIFAIIDEDGDIDETNEEDNFKSKSAYIETLTPAGADLVPEFISAEVDSSDVKVSEFNLCLGVEHYFRFKTKNIGNAETNTSGSQIYTRAFISKDNKLDGKDKSIGTDSYVHLRVGGEYSGGDDDRLRGYSPGDYFLIIKADDKELVPELSESNNYVYKPISFKNCYNEKYPDLTIEILDYSPSNLNLGDYITAKLKITNKGQAPISNFDVELFLSEDQFFDGRGYGKEDIRLLEDGSIEIQDVIAPGQSIEIDMRAYIHGGDLEKFGVASSGQKYLIAAVDELGSFNEYNKEDNWDISPIQLLGTECYFIADLYDYGNEFDYKGTGKFAVHIETEDNCAWNATGVESWIQSPVNRNFTGDYPIYVSLQENLYPIPRIGHINYGNGKVFEFTQAAKPCDSLDSETLSIFQAKATLSGNKEIELGQSSTIKINFTGIAPYSFELDGKKYENINQNYFDVIVSPSETKTYTLTSVKNDVCGRGITSGSATITIKPECFLGDLKITLVEPKEYSDKKVNYDVVVTNVGKSDINLGSFGLSTYASLDNVFDNSDAFKSTYFLGGGTLSPNNSITYNLNSSIDWLSSNHFFVILADEAGLINECDKQNNKASILIKRCSKASDITLSGNIPSGLHSTNQRINILQGSEINSNTTFIYGESLTIDPTTKIEGNNIAFKKGSCENESWEGNDSGYYSEVPNTFQVAPVNNFKFLEKRSNKSISYRTGKNTSLNISLWSSKTKSKIKDLPNDISMDSGERSINLESENLISGETYIIHFQSANGSWAKVINY